MRSGDRHKPLPRLRFEPFFGDIIDDMIYIGPFSYSL